MQNRPKDFTFSAGLQELQPPSLAARLGHSGRYSIVFDENKYGDTRGTIVICYSPTGKLNYKR